MDTLFLATVMGWYLVIMSFFMLFRHEQLKLFVTEFLAQRGLFFITAIFTLILGLLLVASHNLWVMEWPVVITIISWFVLLGSLIRLFFADLIIKKGQNKMKHLHGFKIPAIVSLLVGLYLLSHAYYFHI